VADSVPCVMHDSPRGHLGCDCGPCPACAPAPTSAVYVMRQRPVRRPKASVELPQSVAEHAIESLLRIAEGKALHPDLVAQSLADVLAAALEQAKAEDAR
jgi:hypothetical protein